MSSWLLLTFVTDFEKTVATADFELWVIYSVCVWGLKGDGGGGIKKCISVSDNVVRVESIMTSNSLGLNEVVRQVSLLNCLFLKKKNPKNYLVLIFCVNMICRV